MDEDDGERRALISRIGTYFIVLGLLTIILFIASDVGNVTYFSYFFISAILLIVGFVLKHNSAGPPSPGKRFEALRKARQKKAAARQKKVVPGVDRRKNTPDSQDRRK